MKRIFWIVLILVFLQACAQPPQALPAVPTNISTQAVALATDTPPPTDTATPLPTSTSTPTATFTPTKTATPTLTPVPTSAILYIEDFEDNKANHWNASLGKWTIELEDENHYWKGTGPKAYPQAGMSYNTSIWTDYAFESRIRMVSGTIFILARWNRGNFYAATLNPASDWVDFAEWDRKNYTAFGGNSFPLSYNQWMVVRFEVQGDTLRLYINEQLAALATRTSNAAGGIGYYMGGGEEVHFDDIRVWQLSAP